MNQYKLTSPTNPQNGTSWTTIGPQKVILGNFAFFKNILTSFLLLIKIISFGQILFSWLSFLSTQLDPMLFLYGAIFYFGVPPY